MILFGSLTSGLSDAGEEWFVNGDFDVTPATPFRFVYVDDFNNPYTDDDGNPYIDGDSF